MINEMRKAFLPAQAFLFTALTIGIGMMGCNKSINATGNKSFLALTNLSPGTPPLSIIFETNDTLNNSGQLAFDSTTGMPGNPYLVAIAGIHAFRITGGGQTFVDGNIGLQLNHYYSLFIYDSVVNGKLNTLILQDFLNTPADTSTSIRFINFSPNAPSLFLRMISGIDTISFSNIPFPYVGIDPNPTVLSRVQFIRPGTYNMQAFVDSATSFNLGVLSFYGGKIYTIYSKGLLSSSDTNSLGTIQHN